MFLASYRQLLVLGTILAFLTVQTTCNETDGSRMIEGCKLITLSSSDEPGHLSNPVYPGIYFTERCWVIHMPPEMFKKHLIQVTSADLDLYIPPDCGNAESDFVELREGQSKKAAVVGRWCSGWKQAAVTSCTADLLVWLHVSDEKREMYRGLNISYSLIKRETYDCYTRGPAIAKDPDIEDGAIAGVAIFLLVGVLLVSIIVVLKSRERPNNPDDRMQGGDSIWQRRSPFDHQRFENEPHIGEEAETSPRIHHQPRDSLSESMRSTKPLPIGIPRGAYKADGFPAAYACNIPEINVSDCNIENKPGKSSPQLGAIGKGLNPVYEMAFPESGLPVDPTSGKLPKIAQPTHDPLTASVPDYKSGVQLSELPAGRLSEDVPMSSSAPGGTSQEEVDLSFPAENITRDESFA